MAKARVAVTATDNLAKGLAASKKSLNSFEKYVRGVGDKLSKTFGIAALATATVAGIKGIEKAMKLCVQEFTEAEKVSMRLTAVWNNVGAATGKTAKEMDDYAESLEKVTYFSSESIKEAGLLLAATESLTEEGFDRALAASADLAAALGEDITAAAQTLSKAIQEPEAALSRLKTIGVNFTEDEKAQIKALAEANRQYEAQSIILDKVEQRYQGVAKAINNTPAGKLDNIKDTLSDIRENLGGALLDTLSPALESIYKWLTKISEWTGNGRTAGKVITAVKEGTGLIGFSDADLRTAREDVYGRIFTPSSQAEAEAWAASGTTPWDPILKAIDTEIARRERNPYSETVTSSAPIVNAIAKAVEKAVENPLEDFLKSYGKNSAKYQLNEYNSIIKQAEALREDVQSEISDIMYTTFEGPEYEAMLAREQELNGTVGMLNEVINTFKLKISDLEINNLNLREPKGKSGYSSEWGEWLIPPTFMDSLAEGIKDIFVHNGLELGGTAENFGKGVVDSFIEKMGTAGDVASALANNMATMGPALGSLMTGLEFVFQGLSEVVGPELERMMTALIEPLVAIGKALGSFILPILQLLTPVLNVIAKAIIVVSSTFQYIGQLLQHWVATVLNWLAGLNLLGWRPFAGLSTYDPGHPGSFGSYIQNNLNSFDSASEASVATDTAVSSASYRGATQVTINIYQNGPVVGDGGMREFARMIRDEFDALDYYGVTA